jgi:hypothetical protein
MAEIDSWQHRSLMRRFIVHQRTDYLREMLDANSHTFLLALLPHRKPKEMMSLSLRIWLRSPR